MIREEYWGEEWEFSFVVYKPSEIKEDLPMIIQLHGAGEAGDTVEDLYKVDVHGFSHIVTESTEYPCVFILPQCRTESFWVAEIPNLYSFIQKLKQKFPVNETKIYLTGLSMGGYGTWYTALRYPQLFAAIAPVCGGGMLWKAGVLDMPIWAFHGSEDQVVNVSETMKMIEKIRSIGSNQQEVKMNILDNVGHNAWDYAYTTELLEWLLSKSR
jgi:predicted peptidase